MRLVLLSAVLLAACRSGDPELYAATRREMARFEKTFSRIEAQTDKPLPMKWEQGQYAVWAVTADDETTLVEALVDSVRTDGVAVEVTQLSQRLRTNARLVFSHQPKDLADARASLLQITRRRGDDPAFTYKFLPGTSEHMRDALEPLYDTLLPVLTDGEHKTVNTAAATLEGCTPVEARFAYRYSEIALSGWAHPAIPISGFARGKSKDGESVELMDYGFNGNGPTF